MTDQYDDYEVKTHSYHHILNSKWRVKLYHLNQLGQWDDMGTGHVSIKRNVYPTINLRTMAII
jgi:hypothetical protein